MEEYNRVVFEDMKKKPTKITLLIYRRGNYFCKLYIDHYNSYAILLKRLK